MKVSASSSMQACLQLVLNIPTVYFNSWSARFHRVLLLTNVDKYLCATGDGHRYSTRQALFHSNSVQPMTVTDIFCQYTLSLGHNAGIHRLQKVADRLQQAACSQGLFMTETIKGMHLVCEALTVNLHLVDIHAYL